MPLDDKDLLASPLHELHLELGGKMVPFAGYAMPVQYRAGILKEHQHTRSAAGLFDVSHMGQVRLTGRDAAGVLESLTPVDVIGLGPNRQRYALFTEENGGILDDLMITNAGDHLFVVVNAACKDQDIDHLRSGLTGDCSLEVMTGHALLALQGPAAGPVMARLAPESGELLFMTGREMVVAGERCFVTRSGYTGEDGFEISVPIERAEALARTLLREEEVEPIGLGARDSLRLEAGLCLYGHDIDRTTTPVEASLTWALSKARRPDGERAGGYPGAAVIHRQLAEGVTRRRVGLRPEGKVPLREGVVLSDSDGQVVGKVTSGVFGPTAGGPVAMGYVETAHAKPGAPLKASLRGKEHDLRITRMPFVEQRYHRG